MTPFHLILDSSGLSQREVAAYLNVSYDSVRSWAQDRRGVPGGVLTEMLALIDRQGLAAQECLDQIRRLVKDQGDQMPEEIEIGLSADDHEAQTIGWPTATAHAAVIRRLIEIAPEDIRARIVIVPRGSTVATAAAELQS